ncbi:2-amino-4-hydroxy-6-hydroxymethyldihydropteridine diphosphokinase [Formosa algae]|uniref:2-amino-4-hydroxy-6-hydroxymethyldihydropteridine pyrophosphokinase n=1 Tax=Formosa algae TaxID=225843 RepID=A0A9X0YGS4_9FLAO|nr:2-amino-4-hydroxy-6-hydroxymethyldihydropteridine diphosphokinase [Formosa algae]MBP1838320.1 2-amino-4-hydroxy-6-hydroxymethyldihydropteridine diphosphokinase [Formosa algae]MDQ0334455.1 2-amino-4-hydroxy-6-hydroxymethyldihydropteridine diphosphokinase [Formosa algae]OEI82153.1 2-amino-4-hydroxy-6-hydroxymethyldihydropteridine diphosphokinase [Formosa algae]
MAKHVYISIGSNKGDRFQNLQLAVNRMFDLIGAVENLSKVYTSPAFGFESDPFLNACLIVKTELQPDEVMQTLLDIETALGRTRTEGAGYEARVIDLDIIFIEDEIINTELLKVPHPEMQKRKFVLLPLNDIASKLEHPVLMESVKMLLEGCEDSSELSPVAQKLVNPITNFNFSHQNFIAIEGNIGAGKTSLATKMSEDFNAKLVLERFADNPFLPKFYEDGPRYAFPLEMSFLADRYQQISDDLSQLDLFKDFIVSDYDVFKSLIFSRITLQEDEFKLYRKLFYIMYKDIAKPDLYVYLYQNTERLQQNIKKRGREYEQQIEDDYLNKINLGYLEFLKNQTELKVKIIDISDMDFVANRADYLSVLKAICS